MKPTTPSIKECLQKLVELHHKPMLNDTGFERNKQFGVLYKQAKQALSATPEGFKSAEDCLRIANSKHNHNMHLSDRNICLEAMLLYAAQFQSKDTEKDLAGLKEKYGEVVKAMEDISDYLKGQVYKSDKVLRLLTNSETALSNLKQQSSVEDKEKGEGETLLEKLLVAYGKCWHDRDEEDEHQEDGRVLNYSEFGERAEEILNSTYGYDSKDVTDKEVWEVRDIITAFDNGKFIKRKLLSQDGDKFNISYVDDFANETNLYYTQQKLQEEGWHKVTPEPEDKNIDFVKEFGNIPLTKKRQDKQLLFEDGTPIKDKQEYFVIDKDGVITRNKFDAKYTKPIVGNKRFQNYSTAIDYINNQKVKQESTISNKGDGLLMTEIKDSIIHSMRRLSDGQIFNIGDYFNFNSYEDLQIDRFDIKDGETWASYYVDGELYSADLNKIDKPKDLEERVKALEDKIDIDFILKTFLDLRSQTSDMLKRIDELGQTVRNIEY